MFRQLDVVTNLGKILTLPLEDISNGYAIHSIEGMEPVRANLVSSSFARMDGEQYQSARREKRNIIITLGLEPSDSTETETGSVRLLRENLYTYFMPKREVTLRFYGYGDPTVYIKGRVETFTSPLFVAEPVVTISLLCFNPDFYSPIETVINASTTSSSVNTTVAYGGNVNTGVLFTVNVNRTMSGFTIVHKPEGGSTKSMVVTASLVAGDVVNINTVSGDKYATLTRSGSKTSILYGVAPSAYWTAFEPGSNDIRIDATGAAVPYTIKYTDKYGGL